MAGVDAAYLEDQVTACAVLLDSLTFALQAVAFASGRVTFPYRPGFLALREGSADLAALRNLPALDLLLVDGAGIAHPRMSDLAVYLGENLKVPTIGVTKSPFVGEWAEPELSRDSFCPLLVDGKKRGAVLRTRSGIKPLFVSPGFGLSIEEAVFWTLRMTRVYRQPEPLRLAHHFVKRYRKGRWRSR